MVKMALQLKLGSAEQKHEILPVPDTQLFQLLLINLVYHIKIHREYHAYEFHGNWEDIIPRGWVCKSSDCLRLTNSE
jgi:hypothetical protein